MRLTKIYTKFGDKGATMLASGDRVAKDDLRIEAYGTVDELNATIGLLKDSIQLHIAQNFHLELISQLETIQNELFDLGAELATPADKLKPERQRLVNSHDIERLEQEIDAMNAALAPLENFVLPGGHICNSFAHLSRTVCRRAERLVVSLSKTTEIRSETQIFLNRLSDWLFVFSRHIARITNSKECLWSQKKG